MDSIEVVLLLLNKNKRNQLFNKSHLKEDNQLNKEVLNQINNKMIKKVFKVM